jgi:hypothetical protein
LALRIFSAEPCGTLPWLAKIVAQLVATTDEDLEFVAALRKKHDLPQ